MELLKWGASENLGWTSIVERLLWVNSTHDTKSERGGVVSLSFIFTHPSEGLNIKKTFWQSRAEEALEVGELTERESCGSDGYSSIYVYTLHTWYIYYCTYLVTCKYEFWGNFSILQFDSIFSPFVPMHTRLDGLRDTTLSGKLRDVWVFIIINIISFLTFPGRVGRVSSNRLSLSALNKGRGSSTQRTLIRGNSLETTRFIQHQISVLRTDHTGPRTHDGYLWNSSFFMRTLHTLYNCGSWYW